MKNMIENMLKAEIEEFIENNNVSKNETYSKYCVYEIIANKYHSSTPNSGTDRIISFVTF